MSIKVLLVRDVEKAPAGEKGSAGTQRLGWLGDVVEVSEGYARNYLIPQGLATIPTEDNLRSLAKEKARGAERRIEERGRLESAAAAVEGAEAVIASKANEAGVLFGSVSAEQIAANLRAQGFEVADEVVSLPERIKQVGSSQVTLRFAEDLSAVVTVVVVAEGAALEENTDGDSEGGN